MDKEALQRQVEDLEQASERWRAERRRLNAEIDKLEAALADARSAASRKRAAAEKPQAPDPLVLAKLSEAAQEKLKKATEEWEVERAKLNSQINRLEGNLTEAISRASNPLRATQSVKEQFELELNRVAKEKMELEQAFLRAKGEWENEKLKVAGEMVKLRRSAQITGAHIPKESTPEINPKVRALESQLKDKQAEWNAERERFAAAIHKLEETSRQWDAERRQLNDHAGQLQQAFLEAQTKIQRLEIGARKANPYQVQVEELKREKEGMEREFEAEREVWDEERRRLNAQIGEQRQALKESVPEASPKIRDLENQIEQNLAQWNGERERLVAQIQKLEETSRQWDAERRQINHQAEQLRQALLEAQGKIQSYEIAATAPTSSDKMVAELKREKEALQEQLKEIRNARDSEEQRLNSEVERLKQQLQRISDTSDRVSNEVVDQLRQQYEQKLQEAIEQKTQLAQELQNASTSLEQGRARLTAAQEGGGSGLDKESIQAEVSRVEGQLNEIIAIIEDANTDLSTVIRKNVEKAELDAYLKGMLFATGKKAE